MSVSVALRETFRGLHRNPILFVPVFVVALLHLAPLALRPTSPGLANLFSLLVSLPFVFVAPFVHGGLVGMSEELLDGDTSLRTFVREGKQNYVSLLVVSLCFAVFVGGVVAVVFSVGLFAVFARYPGGAGDTSALVALLVIVLGVVVLTSLLIVFFVQFYAQAVVVDGRRAVGSVKRSVGVVWSNFGDVVGYSLVVAVLLALSGGVLGVSSVVLSAESTTSVGVPASTFVGAGGLALVAVVVSTLVGGLCSVFSVAFYRTLTESP
ncbi:hypothetical protein [Haloprofundus halobius]|uniref:DUF7847 domain-containing protein n=1 Tax=Haloprofundus halobius TaxID=2876194 RepID=UPI001CCF29B2|nr:hypothetical protein [Haloprofundus halobius]